VIQFQTGARDPSLLQNVRTGYRDH